MKETYINYSKSRRLRRRNAFNQYNNELENTQIPITIYKQLCPESVKLTSNSVGQPEISSSEMREAWSQTIKNGGPYSHLFTLSFIRAYTDEQAIAALTTWCSMMNRRIFGPRWKKNKTALSATVIAERHAISLTVRRRLHFHVLIKMETDRLTTSELSTYASLCAMKLKDKARKEMVAPERIDLTEIYYEPGMIWYLLKDMNNPLLGKNGENIGFWQPGLGFTGFLFTPKTGKELKRLH